MDLTPPERRVLAQVLHGFDTPDGLAARAVLRDMLLERGHPWGEWMVKSSSRRGTLQRQVERRIYPGMHRVLTKREKSRKWTDGFLTGGRLRTKHLDDLLAVRNDLMWLPMASLDLAPNQGDRIPDVARFVCSAPWTRLKHLGVDDQRFMVPLIEQGLPASLESVYFWALGGVPAEDLAAALPPTVKRLHVQVFQQLDADGARALFERDWEYVRVDISHSWIRDLAAGRVERLDLHTATFSLFGTARDTGFDWTIQRHHRDIEHHLWRFVQRWPVEERNQVCPDRPPPRDDPREWW